MNLLRENDAPMTLSLALPPISILEFNGETSLWNWYIINHIRGEARNVFTHEAFSQGGY